MLELDLTNDCHNSCIGCWNYSPLLRRHRLPPHKRRIQLPLLQLKKLIDEASEVGTRYLRISGGGEPLLRRDLLEIIAHARERGMKCILVTSFHPIDEEGVRGLVDLGVHAITASIWSATANSYLRTHPNQTRRTFERLEFHLKLLHDYKVSRQRFRPQVKVYYVICALNCGELEQMVEFAREVMADKVEFQVIDIIPGYTECLALSHEHRQYLLEQLKELRKRAVSPDNRPPVPWEAFFEGDVEADLLDFGKFAKDSLPAGFEFRSEPHIHAVCPRGFKAWEHGYYPSASAFVFDFSRAPCQRCDMRDRCPPAQQKWVCQEFLATGAIGTFLRRISEAESERGVYERKLIESLPCYMGWYFARVTTSGNVIPCCKGYRKPMGNIKVQSFKDIWFGQRMQEFRYHGLNSPKAHPYFAPIQCRRACDNLGMNLEIHLRLEELPPLRRGRLLTLAQQPCHCTSS
jgi:MoaA/NifB/PqqE/SkfB family radical SAM enzyme